MNPIRRLLAFLVEALIWMGCVLAAYALSVKPLLPVSLLPWPMDWLWLATALKYVAFLLLLIPLGPRFVGPGLGFGYRSLGLKLADAEGQPLPRWRVLVRALNWWLCTAPLMAGLLPVVRRHRRTWPDRITGAWVLSGRRPSITCWIFFLLVLGPLGWLFVGDRFTHQDQTSRRFGYLDRQGIMVVPPRFKEAQVMEHGFALVKDADQKWGFLRSANRQFTRLQSWGEPAFRTTAMIVARQNDRQVVVDENNQRLSLPVSSRMMPGQTVAAPVMVTEGPVGVAYYDHEGHQVGTQHWEDGAGFSGGMARVTVAGKQGAINAQGKLTVPAAFDRLGPFAQGLASARQGARRGLVDIHGKWVMHREDLTDLLEVPEDGPPLLQACQGEHWGYLDFQGRWAIPPIYEEGRLFGATGYARVRVGPHWGVIDRQGAWVLQPVFEQLLAPGEPPFAAMRAGHWGYWDPQGREIVPPQFAIAGPFKNGSAYARGFLRWYRVDAKGTITPLPWSVTLEPAALSGEWVAFSQPMQVTP